MQACRLKQRISARTRREHALLEENAAEVARINSQMLRSSLLISCLILAGLSIIAMIAPVFFAFRASYMLALAFIILMYALSRRAYLGNKALPLLYCLGAGILGLGAWLSVWMSPNYIGASIVGMFSLLPMMIVDRTHRVNLFVLCVYAGYCVLVIRLKPPHLVVDDICTSGCFMLIGMFLGASMRMTKLENLDLGRQARIHEGLDFLTGLGNRRSLFSVLEGKRPGRSEEPVTGMLMVDVDWFKRFNDSKGHQAGDDCLRYIGIQLTLFAPWNAMEFYRYGGEEFIGLSRAQDSSSLAETSEALCHEIERLGIPHELSRYGRVTVSVGCAKMPDPPCSYEKLIGMADAALYHAKANGRNRVEEYKPEFEDAAASFPTCRQKPRAQKKDS